MSSLINQLLINKTGKIRDPAQAARHEAESMQSAITAESLEINFSAQLTAAERNELETVPRETVLKMLNNKKLDEHFVFNTFHGQGDAYVQAMRQVLSRTRKKALKKRVRLDEFKLFVVMIEDKSDHDIVTLVRTKQMPAHLESVYDALVDAFEKK